MVGEVVLSLTEKIVIKRTTFSDGLVLDSIWPHFKAKDGQWYPKKKGLTLRPENMAKLITAIRAGSSPELAKTKTTKPKTVKSAPAPVVKPVETSDLPF